MKYLFYLLPGLMDVVTGLFFFISAKRMADAGVSSLNVTATMSAWALVYMVISLWLGKVLTRHNAMKILFTGQLLLAAAMLGMILLPSIYMQYVWLLLCGLGTGLFFAPYQAVVKLLEDQEAAVSTFARSTAIYTFSWSMGMATGPTLAAWLWGTVDPVNGWKICYMLNLCIILFTFLTLLVMNHFVRIKLNKAPSPLATSQPLAIPEPLSTLKNRPPDLMLSAWLLGGGGFLAIAVLRAYLPDFATKELVFSTRDQGLIQALMNYAQAFTALFFLKTRRWPYHPYMGSFGSLCGLAALGIFAFSPIPELHFLAAILFGTYSGIFCFNFTYHALANPERCAHYAAINESIVGATSVLAPLGAGLLADHTIARMPFMVAILAVAAAMTGHLLLTWKNRRY